MITRYHPHHPDDATEEDPRCWFATRASAVMFYLAWGQHGEAMDGHG